jgi:hypothetical protein
MGSRRKRSRPTRHLLDATWERFSGCEVCYKSQASDLIEDIVGPLKLRQREFKRLLQRLTCPNCETAVGELTYVVAKTPEQLRQWRVSKKFMRLYGRQLTLFREFLIKYPMLGAEHPFGKSLFAAIKRAKKTVLKPSVFYRAVSDSSEPHFSPRPSHESTRANRYNQIGQLAWYLGSDAKTAAVEKLRAPETGKRIRIAKIKIVEPIAVLDLRSVTRHDDPIKQGILRNVVHSRFISEPTSNIEDTRPEYRVPQFVADLARKRKFRGILYDSTRPSAYNNPEVVGYNLVLFDPIPEQVIEGHSVCEFGEPDYNVMFSTERWPLRILESAAMDQSRTTVRCAVKPKSGSLGQKVLKSSSRADHMVGVAIRRNQLHLSRRR